MGWEERRVQGLDYRRPWSGLKIKVLKIFSQQRDIWEIVLCFDVTLSFSVTTQITAAKQTRLIINSSKRKGGTLYKWSLELLTGFSATAGCYFLGKTRKTVRCTGQKNRTTAITVDKNRKPKTKFEKPTRKPWKTPKPKNHIFSRAKTEKPSQTLVKSTKPKIPCSPQLGNMVGALPGLVCSLWHRL